MARNRKKLEKLGILGGGQLSRMLAQAAQSMGIETCVYVQTLDDPAAQVCSNYMVGGLNDRAKLSLFFSKVDLVIFENEFVDTNLLKDSSKNRVPFFPKLTTIALLQDKLGQKKILKKLAIPTSSFIVFSKKQSESLKAWLLQSLKYFKGSCVLKWSKFGYDGKGTFFLSLKNLEKAISFCESGMSKGAQIYAEEKIKFEKEVALVSCYSRVGEFLSFPLTVTEQKNGICYKCFGPADQFGVPKGLEKTAQIYAKKLSKEVDLFGSFAIEFFYFRNKLFVNEIAPRVHNSAHYTQNSTLTSQFENHIRAMYSTFRLGSTKAIGPYLMLNLLGEKESRLNIPKSTSTSHLHLYGKKECRAGRKMGHVNFSGLSVEDIQKILRSTR
ncbi:MAG: 5-(carboxyamino)imidazole ribonucleotide synthase [Bacteriovoracia bacterium]